jgi:hypothetical protein
MTAKQKILVFQQNGSGERKIAGLRQHGGGRFDIRVISIDTPLPPVVDNGADYLPQRLEADLILDFLGHPDLSEDLAELASHHRIPVVASGKKGGGGLRMTPPT